MYNGHKNWNHWNVSLYINNDPGLYDMARETVQRAGNKDDAAEDFYNMLQVSGITHTPDGAPYSVTTIRAAMRGM